MEVQHKRAAKQCAKPSQQMERALRNPVIVIASLFLISACAETPEKPKSEAVIAPATKKAEPSSQGNRSELSLHPDFKEWMASGPGCITISNTSTTIPPGKLMSGVLSCLNEGEEKHAAELMAFAITRARFDATRISQKADLHHDPRGLTSAHYLELPLAMYYGEEKYKATKLSMKKVWDEHGTEMCQAIVAAGPPTYEPNYIMGYNSKDAATVKRKDRNATTRWETYLNCKV